MTELEAANRALMLLGVAPIGSLSDTTQAARCMSILMDGTKKAVLCEFPWAFALRIVPLSTTTGSIPGYKYVFTKPSDALEVRRVYSSGGNAPMEFRVVGSKIGANESAGKVEYVANVADLDDWPRPIQECLVTRLACDAAMTLEGTPGVAQMLFQKYTAMASHAAEVSIAEEQPPLNRAADHRNYVNARE
jgi:hypothetical protein